MKRSYWVLMALMGFLLSSGAPAWGAAADDPPSMEAGPAAPPTANKTFKLPDEFWVGITGSLVYGPIGIIMAVLGFKVFDWVTPRIDIQKELAEKQNMAVAVVCVAIILGVCYLVTHIVH